MISEKIILQTDFKEIAAIQLALCVRGKKSITRGLGKQILTCTQTKPPIPPPQKSNGHPLKKNWTKTRRTITKKAKGLKLINVVVHFSSQIIFVFLLFLGVVMFANEVETKEK